MEEIFKKLQSASKNSVDNLLKWLKDCKIIDGKMITEDKARKLFEGIKDSSNVELGKFKEAIGKLASEQKKSVEEFSKLLAAEGPKFLQTVLATATSAATSAATSTFKNAFSMK